MMSIAQWLRAHLFNSIPSALITLLLGALMLWVGISFFDWAILHAVWRVPHDANGVPQTDACRVNHGIGACWAIIGEKYRLILFGVYPWAQQWRPALCVGLFLVLYVISAIRRCWRRELAVLWCATLTLIFLLMWGGMFGLPWVPEDQWGGLPVTLILATFGLALAFPLAMLTALGRRSRSLPILRWFCVAYVELIRGVPLISVLFMASVMFPLFMPQGLEVDKLLRAQIAIMLFAAAYFSEVIRAGLQALPNGQYEAADALGLGYWQKIRLVVMPQALRLVIPPLLGTSIGFFKDTSLVVVIGLYDLMMAGHVAVQEPMWQSFSTEVYMFLALIYFAFCHTMSRYSRFLAQG